MKVVTLVEPSSLVGQSVREALEAEDGLELRLVSAGTVDYGTLTRVRDEVVAVQPLSAESLSGSRLVVVCGDAAAQRATLELLPPDVPAIVVASEFESPGERPWVRGVNESTSRARLTISPHPIVVMLSRLLSALAPHRPTRLAATVLLPASARDGRGLDELLEQTRAILAFSEDRPTAVFGRQLAFNVLPGPAADALDGQVREILGFPVEVAVHLLQGPVFHGLAASLLVELDGPASDDELRRSLAAQPGVGLAQAPEGLGPIDVAGRSEILLGDVRREPGRPDAVWLWAVFDHLAGGAADVLELARRHLAAD